MKTRIVRIGGNIVVIEGWVIREQIRWLRFTALTVACLAAAYLGWRM